MGNCVSCSGDLGFFRRYDFKTENFRRVYSDGNVYRCLKCGLVQVDTSKVNENALSRYYRTEYRAVAEIGAGGSEWPLGLGAVTLAKLAAEHVTRPPERIFELGAGYGYNLLEMKKVFPTAELFTEEPDETIELPAAINRAALSDGGYDVIILSHVLEHLTHPKPAIRRIIDALADGGIVVIEVPNDVPKFIPGMVRMMSPTSRSSLSRR